MKRPLSVAIVLALVVGSANGSSADPWRALVVDDGGAYFRGTVMTPERTPVSFVYDGRLKFADPSAEYEITDADTGRSVRRRGRDLRESGYLIVLPERKSSALLRMKRVK